MGLIAQNEFFLSKIRGNFRVSVYDLLRVKYRSLL